MSQTTLETGTNQEATNLSLTNAGPGAGADVSRYVVVEVNGSKYGIVTDATVELRAASSIPVTRVPKSPRFVRGVINHRGSIIPVVDTRALLGLPTAEDQGRKIIETMNTREREHAEWLDALEQSIKTGDKFEKPTDPTLCAFGRWHKEVSSDPKKLQAMARYEPAIKSIVDEMEAPHRRIHRVGEELIRLRDEGKRDEALSRLNAVRESDFGDLRRLFRRIVQGVSKGMRSMLVITELGDRRAAFVVDAVHTVKDCAESQIEPLPDSASGSEFLRGLVHQSDGGYILICDIERMYELACPR